MSSLFFLFYALSYLIPSDCNIVALLQAFASQYIYCQKKLGLDPEKINVNGGAMAIGHPLGATGTCSQKK